MRRSKSTPTLPHMVQSKILSRTPFFWSMEVKPVSFSISMDISSCNRENDKRSDDGMPPAAAGDQMTLSTLNSDSLDFH